MSEELTEDPARAWLAAVDGSPEVCREQALGTLWADWGMGVGVYAHWTLTAVGGKEVKSLEFPKILLI